MTTYEQARAAHMSKRTGVSYDTVLRFTREWNHMTHAEKLRFLSSLDDNRIDGFADRVGGWLVDA